MTEDEDCAECGDPEFDKDGNETHLDEEEYDHDFEAEEPTTLEDVKEFADTVKSLVEAGKAVKELTRPSKINYSEPSIDRFKTTESKVSDFKISDIKITHPEEESKKRHKETIKWAKIGIAVGAIIGIIAIASSMF
ncbi:MAG: hypothetical protein COA77_06385 [Thaumarchaeota archaeon]|nr:MAG: hypothetical protein COA77_06385 [Nitrososphaerota archaeon]